VGREKDKRDHGKRTVLSTVSAILKAIQTDTHPEEFKKFLPDVFLYLKTHNPVYRTFLEMSGRADKEVHQLSDITFLPVSFFKSHFIITGENAPETIFRSSTTTGAIPSQHPVSDLSVYRKSLTASFRFAWGNPSDYIFLALLPSYLERNDSSLVFMMQELMHQSGHPLNGFFLHDYEKLAASLSSISSSGVPCIFTGVTFALSDFAEKHPMPLSSNITIMETGGMKGRSNNIPRNQLHHLLCKAFGKESIAGEYGMTEMLSQCYSKGNGRYMPPPWVKVMVRDLQDPFSHPDTFRPGGIDIIDLANIHSCPFIATDDTGVVFPDGSFEITGRISGSDIRGCNLMA
jgi:hypothetical protein